MTQRLADWVDSQGRHLHWLIGMILVSLLANIAGWLFVGIHTDEAFYWVWSERLEWSYFDHPPMVAWMIRFFTALFGDKGWVIRIPAVINWFVIAWVLHEIARRVFRQQRFAGIVAVLIFSILPIVQVGFHIITPDVPLLLFTGLTYYLVYRAVEEGQPRLWLVAGFTLGAAFLSKYTAALVPSGIFFALLLAPEGRRQLQTPWPWLGLGIAALMFLPVVYWNYEHDWISFRYQLAHGAEEDSRTHFEHLFNFIGGQLGVVLPWVFLAMVAAGKWARPLMRPDDTFGYALLLVGFWLPILFFGIAGTTAHGEANWTATAYLPGTILLAGLVTNWLFPEEKAAQNNSPLSRLLIGVVVLSWLFSLALVNLIRFPFWVHWFDNVSFPKTSQAANVVGWDQLGDAVRAELAETAPAGGCRVSVSGHLLAAQVALQLEDVDAVAVSTGSRDTQHTIWQREGRVKDRRPVCLLVKPAQTVSQLSEEIFSNSRPIWKRRRIVKIIPPDKVIRWYGIYSSIPAEH